MEKRKSKKITLRFAKQNKQTWLFIKEGKKTIETRAATSKYKDVQPGDTVVLSCEGSKFEKVISNVAYVKSIEVLAKQFDLNKINPGITDIKETKRIYFSYPGYEEKIKEFGLVALELQ